MCKKGRPRGGHHSHHPPPKQGEGTPTPLRRFEAHKANTSKGHAESGPSHKVFFKGTEKRGKMRARSWAMMAKEDEDRAVRYRTVPYRTMGYEGNSSASGDGVVSYVYHSKSTTVPYFLPRTNISRKHGEMY